MPHTERDQLEETLITPSRTQSKGKTIMGKSLLLQRILHCEDWGDGHGGAKTHSHPEEQIFIALKGKMKICARNEWFTMEPEDIFLMSTDTEHEEKCDEDFLWLSNKNRIPGHSWYDGSWKLGVEEDRKKVKAILDEMDRSIGKGPHGINKIGVIDECT